MKTNAGTRVIDDEPMLVAVWYDEKMIANICGFTTLKDKYPITYSIDNDAFYVQLTPNKYIVLSVPLKAYMCINPPSPILMR